MTDIGKELYSTALFNLVTSHIDTNLPIKIIVSNHNDWDMDLPHRLKNEPQFILEIDGQTLDDCTTSEDLKSFHVSTEFDGVIYNKTFISADVHGIVNSEMKPIFVKPYIEEHPKIEENIKGSKQLPLDKKGIEHSMKLFKKNNPEMFN